MRVALIHNPTAGDEQHEAEELLAAIEDAGYEHMYASIKSKGWDEIVSSEGIDLVAVAGGDGSIAKVAKKMAGGSVPLTILPLGTANNIARSLNISGSTEELIRGWKGAARRRYHLGLVKAPWKDSAFLESVGFGVIPLLIEHSANDAPEVVPSKPAEQVKHYAQRLIDLVRTAPPQQLRVVMNGKESVEDYLLFEVMNIRSIGPNLILAPEADPSRQEFQVVTIKADEREQLLEFLKRRRAGEQPHPLPTFSASQIQLYWNGTAFHRDDKLLPEKLAPGKVESTRIDIGFDGAYVDVLAVTARERREQPTTHPASSTPRSAT